MPTPNPHLTAVQQVESAVLHDARAVHDTSTVRLRDFEAAGVPSWVLATVTPGLRSGSAMIPGAFIRAETGEFVAPEAAATVLVKEGSWKAIAAARQPEQHGQGDYSWTEPLQQKRLLQPEDFYSPFVHGGTILCRPTPGKPGIDQFGPVSLLLPEWGQYVAAAFDFAEHHGGLFEEGGIKPGDADLLVKVLFHENKLIAALAFRGLIGSKSATPALIRTGLAQDDARARAVLSELVLEGPEPGAGDPLVQEVVDSLRAAPDVNRVRPIALGAFAAALFRVRDRVAFPRAKAVLSEARRRLRELGAPIEAEPDLLLIFEKMDVRP